MVPFDMTATRAIVYVDTRPSTRETTMHDEYDHLRESADAAAERVILADFDKRAAERAALTLAIATIPYIVTREGRDRYTFTVPRATRQDAIRTLTPR